MALVNPNIALSVKPVELADPMAQYGRIAQFQAAQNQNQLAQYQLGAAQRVEARDIARTNALAGAGSDETAIANALLRSGDIPGYSAFVKAAEDRKTQRLTQQKTQGDIEAQPLARRKIEDELFGNSMKQIQSSWGSVRTPEEALAIHDATHRDPIINKRLQAFGVTEEMGRRQILEAAQSPQTFAQFVQKAQLGAEKFMEMNKPTTQVVDQSGQRQVIQIPGLGGKPVTVGTYAVTPLPAAVADQRAQIARAGAPTITNVQEKAEAGAFGKMLVDQFGDISKQASVAARTLPSIDANLALLNKGLATGFGTDAKAAGARVLGALGVQNAEKYATDTQTFQANAISAVLQKQLEQKGVQTDQDAKRIEQIGAQLGKTKEANEFILSVAKEQLKRDIEQRNFYANWKSGAGKGSFDGAENAWFSGEGNKSLFDRPALKKYGVTSPAAPAASQIPTGAGAAARAPAASTPATSTGNAVSLPDGRVMTFPNADAAAKFRKDAGL